VILTAAQFAAHSVGELLRIPSITVMYSPTALRSRHHPPIMATRQGLPRWVNALTWKASDAVLHAMLAGAVNAERGRRGLAPVASVSRHFFEEHPVLMACDPVIAPAPPDWAGYDVDVTGPWFHDDAAALDPAIEAFLGEGPAPVYVGFGSMPNVDADRLTRSILGAAGGRRMLLAKGWAGIGGGSLPPSAMVASGPVAHARLFPRVSCVVHHGGSGTTASALRAGVAQVIVPHLMDQYYYAHRLEWLGIAPPGIPIRKLTPGRLAKAIEAAIAMPAGPRAQAAARLREGEGVRNAADAVEARVR
jgi:UDP:flavonoid glycosyltransferase YjiC (YdhE family)